MHQGLCRCRAERSSASSASSAGESGAASASAPPASASYQRGMEWADRVLNARDVFKSAISTSLESVSALAVPQAVQDQLEELIVANGHIRPLAEHEHENRGHCFPHQL